MAALALALTMLMITLMSGSLLKKIYERECNATVCDRTWNRIKKRLGIREPVLDVERAEVGNRIKAYAYLRQVYPNRQINLCLVQRFIELKFFLAGKDFSQCTGKDIYELAQHLNPKPSDSTLYRWGEEIGVKFSQSKVYVGDEVNKWVEWIAANPRYEYKPYRSLDNGQNQRTA